jgi:uncharacterized protein YkwD
VASRPGLTRRAASVRTMVTVMLLAVGLFSAPAWAQWSGHTGGQLHPGTRASLFSLMGVEEAVFAMTNDLRRRNGLPVFLKDESCRDAARGHSADMFARNYFDHADPEGRSVKERLPGNPAIRLWGENIWTGRGYDPRQTQYLAHKIMDSWMNSPGHRKNILSPGYTHLGVGVITDHQEVKATQVFIGVAAAGIRPGPVQGQSF